MWKKIQDSPHYFIKFIYENSYEIYITDYLFIWSKNFTRKEFLECLEESNEGLEYSDEDDFLKKGCNILLCDPNTLKRKSFELREGGKIMEMALSIFLGYTLKFKCNLSKGSEQLFYDKITKPLLKKNHDLQSSQSELIDLLKRKDEEIFAYKSKGQELSLKSVKTIEFNEVNHLSHFNLSDSKFEPYELLKTTINYPVNEEIGVKQETGSSSLIKLEQKPPVKVEPQPNHVLPTNGCASGTMNIISVDNIKQEVVDHPPVTSDIPVKRQKKKAEFITNNYSLC